jgi:hypothetical protein
MRRWIVLTMALAVLAPLTVSGAASAQGFHDSRMAAKECADEAPGDCPSTLPRLEITAGRTVEMDCWTTGPYTDGSGKWFMVTTVSGAPDLTGFVPANSVSGQWLSSPSCYN